MQTTVTGKIYRLWMDLKVVFSTDNRKALLESCEYGEDSAQTAYRSAEQETGISTAARELISRQKAQLRSSHNQVKELRNREKAGA